MREIKYRQLVGNRWHYWGYIDGCFIGPITNHQPNPINCQYTGLKDANGVEIYEGDLLESSVFICPVRVDYWGELGMYRLSAKNEDCGDFIEYSPDRFKVIGNIYENPELLK